MPEIPAIPEAPLPPRTILGLKVAFEKDGARTAIKEEGGERILKINSSRFPDQNEAVRKAATEAAYISSLKTAFGADRDETVALLKDKKIGTKRALHLRGIKALKLWEPELSEEIAQIVPTHLSARDQFDFACEEYLLTGKFPDGLSKKVSEALLRMPARKGQNVLDVIAQERRSLQSAVLHFEKYVAPLRAEAAKVDAELKKTEREDYVPPQSRGETEPMNPENARFKVFPPVYGYYRGRIFRYDTALKRLVAEVTEKSKWQPQQLPENEHELTRHTYEGKYQPCEENVLPMPYRALPLPESIEPADAFVLMRDRNGTFSLEPKKEITEPVTFKFTFLMCETLENEINDEPLAKDREKFPGPLDEKSQQTLAQIRADTFLSELDRARGVTSFTRKKFVYPEEN